MELGDICRVRCVGGSPVLVDSFASPALQSTRSTTLCGEKCLVRRSSVEATSPRFALQLLTGKLTRSAQICGSAFPGGDQIEARRAKMTRPPTRVSEPY